MSKEKLGIEVEYDIDPEQIIHHLDEYQKLALRTNNNNDFKQNVIASALGLCGESGEVSDLVKKWVAQGHALNSDKIIEEIGDVMWYISLMANTLGYTLSEIATLNIEKLKKRYPDGFDPDKSRIRYEK